MDGRWLGLATCSSQQVLVAWHGELSGLTARATIARLRVAHMIISAVRTQATLVEQSSVIELQRQVRWQAVPSTGPSALPPPMAADEWAAVGWHGRHEAGRSAAAAFVSMESSSITTCCWQWLAA